MKQYRIKEIEDTAQEDDGICLNCHTRQPRLERRLILGLCEKCGEQEVASGELILAVAELINWEGEE